MNIIFIDLEKIDKSEHENIKDQCFMQFYYPYLDTNPNEKYNETKDMMEWIEVEKKEVAIGKYS